MIWSACETSSIVAATSSRSILRALSSTLAWSAASAASNSVWSIGKSGGAATAGSPLPESRWRRYSSRAAAWSSGKPSNPRAWAKRTTVELEVLARRASSSAVWKAASSRWSTMYCPTSFCDRENSSNRCRISDERVSADVPNRVTRKGFARAARVPSVEVRVGRHAPVDEESGAGHVVGVGAREPGHGRCDLLGLAQSAVGDLRLDLPALVRVIDQLLVDRREDRTGPDVHHADPLGRELLGDRLCEQLHAALARAVVGEALPR